MHPWLLAGGSLLIVAPILIHLLNKRRFRIIDWAAMDFLFEADKRNRRRVRLEDLLILLLRCLAVLLVAALLSRPFWSSSVLGGLPGTVSYERIVLLDDSPSMGARDGAETVLEHAKRDIVQLVRGLSSQSSADTFTLLVTSRPRHPIVAEAPLSRETVDRLVADLGGVKVSCRPAHYEDALAEVERQVAGRTVHLNRLLYIVGDLRRRDWSAPPTGKDVPAAVAALKQLSAKTTASYLVDAGNDEIDNLAITAVTPQEKVLAAGLDCRFEVTVRNFGPSDVSDVGVRFTPEGSLPLEGRIERIAAGQSASLPFNFTFARQEPSASAAEPPPIPIRAELFVPPGAPYDRLAADNVRYYPARVVRGIHTLVVDGDPTAEARRAESYFLCQALAPRGAGPSGIDVQKVTVPEFETLRLNPFEVIYLANVAKLSDERRESLERWVRRGGGLVIALGDQLFDVPGFNTQMFRNGQGLSPVEIEGEPRGDERKRQWALFNIVEKKHEVLGIFEGENQQFLDGVKIFRWWQCRVPEKSLQSGNARILARLTDADSSPVIVEKTFGKEGRVVALTTPLDADWSDWPLDPSYFGFVQELTRYMAPSTVRSGLVEIGEPIRSSLDLVKYKYDVTLTRPGGSKISLQPTHTASGPRTADEFTWLVSSAQIEEPGFYRLDLTRNDGGSDAVLFAANLDPNEGDLTRADAGVLGRQLKDANVKIIGGPALASLGAEASKAEMWLYVLGALGLTLGSEQLLAWQFGRKR